MPVRVTAIYREVSFNVLPKRQCEVSFSIEGEDGSEKWITLLFTDVEAYKCTYLTSLGSLNRDLRTEAYGKVISIGESPWLAAVNQNYHEYHKNMPPAPKTLQHLMICFDDGPCYEFICESFIPPVPVTMIRP
jgi:hypothetical protein